MADEVKIPINLEVTDLDVSKVNPKDLENGIKSKLDGLRKAVDGVFKSLDTSYLSKEFGRTAKTMNDSFRNVEKTVKDLSKTMRQVDLGKASMTDVEKATSKVVAGFTDLGAAYKSFSTDAKTESALTPKFRNALTLSQDLVKELQAYEGLAQKASQDSNTTTEYWEKLDILTKSAKANLQMMLADLREMVKEGTAFKAGFTDTGAYSKMIQSLQGKGQWSYGTTAHLTEQGGANVAPEIIEARKEVDKLTLALTQAEWHLEAIKKTDVNPDAVRQAEAEVSNLSSKLEAARTSYDNLYDAAYGITQATTEASGATASMGASAQQATTDFEVMSGSTAGLQSSLNTIVDILGKLTVAVSDMGNNVEESFEQGSQKIEGTKHKANELKEVLKSTKNVTTAMIMTLQQFGSVGTIISQIIGIVQLLADAFRDVSTAAHSIIPIIGIFVGLAINIFGRLVSILKKIVALLKQIALAIWNIAKKIGGTLASGIKNLFSSLIPEAGTLSKVKRIFTQYLLGFRSSYFLIRKIRKAVIDGMKDIAAAAPEVYEYMNNFYVALNQVKGSLTAAFEPILSYVLPILTRLLNMLTSLLTALAKFNAVLMGRDYYYDYAANMNELADSMGGVGKAAKKAQRDLMGFDEINRLSGPNEGGGGGGGLGGKFTKTAIDTEEAISEFAKMVKEAWKKADFTEVGQYIGQKVSKFLNDGWFSGWNNAWTQMKYKLKVERVAKSIGTFINGFVETPDLGFQLGEAIAKALNLGIYFFSKLLNTVHWDSVGKFIGDSINGLFLNFDWTSFFVTLTTFFNSMSTMIINFAKTVQWWQIGYNIANGIIEGIKNWDATSAGKAIHDFFMGIFDMIRGFLDRMEEEITVIEPTNVGSGYKYVKKNGWTILGEKLKLFFTSINTAELGKTAGETLSRIISGVVDFLTAADFHESVFAFFDAFLKAMNQGEWKKKLSEYWSTTLWPAITGLIKLATPWVKTLLGMLWELIKGPVADIAGLIGKEIAKGVWNAMKSWFEENAGGVTDAFGDLGEIAVPGYTNPKKLLDQLGVGDDDTTASNKIKTISNTAQEETKTVKQVITDFTTTTSSAGEAMATATQNSLKNVDEALANAFNKEKGVTAGSNMFTGLQEGMYDGQPEVWFSEKFTDAEEGMTSPFDETLAWAQGVFNIITTVFNVIPAFFQNTFQQAWDNVKAVFEDSGDVVTGMETALSGALKSEVNGLLSGLNVVLNGTFTKLNTVFSSLKKYSVAGEYPFAGIPTLYAPEIPRLAKGAVLPPNQPFLSIVGDQKSGTNVEAPLETIKQAVAEVMGDNAEILIAGFEAVVQAIQEKDMDVIIGDKQIGESNARYEREQNRIRGYAT